MTSGTSARATRTADRRSGRRVPGLAGAPGFPPSWVDRLTAMIDRLPTPPWLTYAILFPIELAALSTPFWMTGRPPFPEVDRFLFLTVVWTVTPLALIHHLDRLAGPALERFRPACQIADDEAGAIRYALQNMPARGALAASLAGLGLLAYFLVFQPGLVGRTSATPLTPLQWFVATLFFLPNYALLGALIYHTLRQLRLIDRVYRRADRLELFNLSPLYAFAGLAARTVIGWALALYLTLALYPEFVGFGAAVIAFGVQVALLGLAFTLPLLGVHRRIRDAKERALADVGGRLTRAIAELTRATDKRSLREMDALNKMVSALVASQEALEKVPTWPWRPGTPVAVATALFLPVVLYLAERLVGGLLGL